MSPRPDASRIAAVLILIAASSAAQASAQETERPLLSDEIRTVLERDGAEAAQQRFDEIFPEHRDEYEIDPRGLAELGSEYMSEGDHQTGQMIMMMVSQVAREMMGGQDMPEMMQRARAEQQDREREQERRDSARPATPTPDYGPSRDDLGRFAGVYGDPDNPDSSRQLFVSASCDGYLVAGAMWGDAQNWWMRSASDNVFTLESDFMSLRLEFELGSDDTAEAMIHDLDGLPSPLQRVGPLPEGWRDCIQRRGG